MLIEFRFQNHRSIRDEQTFTMEAAPGRDRDPQDRRPRTVGYNKDLLPAAAFYGANASGKSNVLSALGFMRDAVLDSHPSWPPQGGVPRDAFAWGNAAREPSMFEVMALIRGVRYRYGFVVDEARVVEEWLHAWPKGRLQTWLEREQGVFSFGDGLKGENRVIEQVTRDNALFLSTAAQHNHEQLLPIHGWFRDLRTVRVEGYKQRYADAMPAASAAAMFAALAAGAAASAAANGMVRVSEFIRTGEHGESVDRLTALDPAGAERVRELLKAADMGIEDFRAGAAEGAAPREGGPSELLIKHRGADGGGWLAFERESAGTRSLLQLGPLVIEALDRGSVLVIDELEASLHPLLALEIVEQFNDPEKNPRNAQLLFTTHDTNLLGATGEASPLRRDQIWLTEKDNEGATSLYPLTDFEPRKAENVERGYLQGRYGAIPFLGRLAG